MHTWVNKKSLIGLISDLWTLLVFDPRHLINSLLGLAKTAWCLFLESIYFCMDGPFLDEGGPEKQVSFESLLLLAIYP